MRAKRALVLSGGGLFGAWQAGAWSVLAQHYRPDLIVGCSIGALNAYLIASGATPDELLAVWRNPEYGNLRHLETNLGILTQRFQPGIPLAIVVTDLLRMKPEIYRDSEITPRHLAASCAVPLLLPQVKLKGRWSTDGGLLNPLPLWAAARLGATEIVGLHVLDQLPSWWMRAGGRFLHWILGTRRTAAVGAKIPTRILKPSRPLGNLKSTIQWDRQRIEDWIALGQADVRTYVTEKSFPF